MVVLGGGCFLMSEASPECRGVLCAWRVALVCLWARFVGPVQGLNVEGYLAHKKPPHPRTLQ